MLDGRGVLVQRALARGRDAVPLPGDARPTERLDARALSRRRRSAGTAARSDRRTGSGRARRTGPSPGPVTSIRSVRPSSARSAATRATPGPHIMPCPPGEATVAPSIVVPSVVITGPEDRQVVGRVVDRPAPRLADAEALRHRHERVEAALHPPQVRPVDLPRRPGRLLRVRHAPEQAALLQTPVDARRRRRRPSAGARRRTPDAARSRPPGGARRRRRSARPTSAPTARRRGPARQDHALGRDHAVGRLARR